LRRYAGGLTAASLSALSHLFFRIAHPLTARKEEDAVDLRCVHSFQGVVAFSSQGDRIALTQIEQMIGGQYRKLGYYDTQADNLTWFNNEEWVGGKVSDEKQKFFACLNKETRKSFPRRRHSLTSHNSVSFAGSSGSHNCSTRPANGFIAVVHLYEYNFQLRHSRCSHINRVQCLESTSKVSTTCNPICANVCT
jgi:hypothetical protein